MFTKYTKSRNQILHEVHRFVFTEVVKSIQVGTHFYGFSDELDVHSREKTGKRIFFQKTTQNVSGIHIGPAHVRPPRANEGGDLKPGDLLCGEIAESPKGTYFTTWIPHAAPVFHFVHYLARRIKRKKLSVPVYNALALTNQPFPDDLWALFLLLSTGNVHDFVMEMLPPHTSTAADRIRHPVRRKSQFQCARGFELSRDVEDFVFFAAMFARHSEIFDSFLALCARYHVPTDEFEQKYTQYLTSIKQ